MFQIESLDLVENSLTVQNQCGRIGKKVELYRTILSAVIEKFLTGVLRKTAEGDYEVGRIHG